MAFHVLIAGGLGQVGAAVVRALAAEPSCAEVVMVNRRAIALTADSRVRQVILDTAAARFPAEVTRLAQSMVAQGDPVYGACCVGVGQGSMKWSEEELKALEIGVVGDFARGCRMEPSGGCEFGRNEQRRSRRSLAPERFRAKWTAVRVKKRVKTRIQRFGSDSIRTKQALVSRV
jgi:hypothetical protein